MSSGDLGAVPAFEDDIVETDPERDSARKVGDVPDDGVGGSGIKTSDPDGSGA